MDLSPPASATTAVRYRGRDFSWSWPHAAWVATDSATGASVRVEPLFKQEPKQLEPQPPTGSGPGKRRPNPRAEKGKAKGKRGKKQAPEEEERPVVVEPLPTIAVDSAAAAGAAAATALGAAFRPVVARLAADIAEIVEEARR